MKNQMKIVYLLIAESIFSHNLSGVWSTLDHMAEGLGEASYETTWGVVNVNLECVIFDFETSNKYINWVPSSYKNIPLSNIEMENDNTYILTFDDSNYPDQFNVKYQIFMLSKNEIFTKVINDNDEYSNLMPHNSKLYRIIEANSPNVQEETDKPELISSEPLYDTSFGQMSENNINTPAETVKQEPGTELPLIMALVIASGIAIAAGVAVFLVRQR
jgi:hypothetical protein